MKIKNLIFLSIIIFLTSCVLEPPTNIIYCSIVNKTDSTLFIYYETPIKGNVGYDTVHPGKMILKDQMFLGCTKHLKDSVIYRVFTKLQISTETRTLKINPFLKSNWNEVLDVHGLSCKNGTLRYNLIIRNANFNN